MHKKMTKQEQLDALYAPYKKCKECPLANLGRTNVVFGTGNPNATLMFIGEGPGRDEDIQNAPFVGRSGQLLTKCLNSLNIKREDVFITNIVKCRPPNNRRPTPQESATCKNLLLFKQIKIIDPLVICTLGSVAIQELLSIYDASISSIRGKPHVLDNTIVIPTYHPAYILRNPAMLNTFTKDLAFAQKACDQMLLARSKE
jgi:uracil-DNA glycosylase family 4